MLRKSSFCSTLLLLLLLVCSSATSQAASLPTSLGLRFSNAGNSSTLTAQLYPYAIPGEGTDGGTVTFYSDSTVLGTALLSSGFASLTLTTPAPGVYVYAVYPGSGSFQGCISGSVEPGGDPATFVTSLGLRAVGGLGTLTLNAQLYPYTRGSLSTDGEPISFYANSTLLNTAPLSAGNASLTIPAPAADTTFYVGYGGDGHFQATISNSIQPVASPQTITTLGMYTTQPTALQGTLGIVKAFLYPPVSQTGVSSDGELVTFRSGGVAVGTAALSAGVATMDTSVLPVGAAVLDVVYAGNSGLTASRSNRMQQTIVPSGTQAAATPVISPGSGIYADPQTVSITEATPGAIILYTVNGSIPNNIARQYTASFVAPAGSTIQAVAYTPSLVTSAIGSAIYTQHAATAAPVLAPAPGTYAAAQSVTLSSATPGAVIYYTTDGSAATTASPVYNGAIPVAGSTTVNAISVAPGYASSDPATGAYFISATAAPVPSLASGIYSGAQKVTLSDTTANASLYYTLDGSAPSATSLVYSGPISISSSVTLQAIAYSASLPPSPVVQRTYSINGNTDSGAMLGLSYYLRFADGNATTIPDVSGNHKDATLSNAISTTPVRPATYTSAGIIFNDQMASIPNAAGVPTFGLCAYFPSTTPTAFTGYRFTYSLAVGGDNGYDIDGSYGIPLDHNYAAFFPEIGRSNGGAGTLSTAGISGNHCVEAVVGSGFDAATGGPINDRLFVDGVEVTYVRQGITDDTLVASQKTNPINFIGYPYSGSFYQPLVMYSAWSSTSRDTAKQAAARASYETSRLAGLGVVFGDQGTSDSDSSCTVDGTSIDAGYKANQTPLSLLNLDFPCTPSNFAEGGQAPKDMAAAYEDREGRSYHRNAPRNIAYHGGVTNGVIQLQESPANALNDVLAWNKEAHAQGWKTIASTMLSRGGDNGYQGQTPDQLKKQFNALLLAQADQFDWVANLAATPQLGADSAYQNATYFADTVHPNNTGQVYLVAAMRAGFEGVYSTASTTVSAAYTQLPSDTLVIATGSQPFSITLMDANTANFNSRGRACFQNNASAPVTLLAVNGQTVGGSTTATVNPNSTTCIHAAVADPVVAGANWNIVP